MNTTIKVIGAVIGSAIAGYLAGVSSPSAKKKMYEEKIEKLNDRIAKLKDEVGTYESIDFAKKDAERFKKSREEALEGKKKAELEYNDISSKLEATKKALTSELKRMDPSYEEHLLDEITSLKKKIGRMSSDLENAKSEATRNKENSDYYRNLYFNK